VRKQAAVDFFGGYPHTAVAMGVSESTVRRWPEELPSRIVAEVIGTAVQTEGVDKARRAFPACFRKPRGW